MDLKQCCSCDSIPHAHTAPHTYTIPHLTTLHYAILPHTTLNHISIRYTAPSHIRLHHAMILQVAVKKNKSYVLRFFWDIFLFRNAPSFTPDLATALGTALPFFSVYWFDWSYIALLFVALSLFLSEKFTLPTITTSKTGLAWGIIATAEYSYYINVGPEFETLINSVVIFIGLAICYTLHRACSTRAHSLPPDVDRSDSP